MSGSEKKTHISPIGPLALILAILLTALASAAVSASAQTAQNKIAFDKGGQLWTMNADGSGQTAIGNLQGLDPSWSPDGTRIAFECGIEYLDICVANADGTNLVALTDTHNNSNPAWAPGGQRIAFTSYREGDPHIFIMGADGSNVQRLQVNDPNITDEDHAAWSPDGTRIAFVGSTYDYATGSGASNVYTAKIDGSDIPARVSPASDIYQKGGTAWSPDGQRIAYSTFYQTGTIHVVNVDGTPAGVPAITDGEYNESPAWSSDGKQLAFYRKYIFRDGDGVVVGSQEGLYVMQVETGIVTSLNAQGGYNPAFRPAVKQPDPDPLPTPADRISELIKKVNGFGLPFGITNSLTVKLRHALDAVNAGDTQTACSNLASFISEVRAQSGKKLTTQQANYVITEATSIRAALGCQ